ncbi:hypothetical protein FJR38_26375 [Anabaena sp. UHCC 0253]|uniref:hypothetical protein n=1 Tax=Anabaena sp. UHCC 0253 TaxID=2590019 RepID=UPI0014453E3D|nr:hypothetical protein [Anabaena sp. UHCC 0253]MTJ55932.1 hypothetical protein [Anabaena sp. UHCC 0253]
MNNLQNKGDMNYKYLDLWQSNEGFWSQKWLIKAQTLNDKLFSNQSKNSESITEIIVQLREVFEQMLSDVNEKIGEKI